MSSYLAPLLDRVVQNELQAQALVKLRDTLLPRLISGQLRLPEADAVAEGAV
jgi:type I restriction enzyme, S subunit